MKDYEKLLPAEAAFWETKNNPGDTKTIWVPVEIQQVSATGGSKLARKTTAPSSPPARRAASDYLMLGHSPLTNITGVMLEALPDERLPNLGPGRNDDGNFVLSEIELSWAAGTNAPDTEAKFADARADYSQNDFPVSQAIDGKVYAGRNGWAIGDAPCVAAPHRHCSSSKIPSSAPTA